jgi:hypothetical protein
MIKKFDYTAILGWSVSRYDRFKICKRQYYYEYYAKFDSMYPKYKIDELKKLTSVPLAIGITVHEVIKVLLERLLKSEEEIDIKRFLDFARRETEEYCRKNTFAEVYYKEINFVNPQDLFNEIEKDLMNFLNSKRYKWLKTKAINNKDNWLIEPSGYGECRLQGIKAYCKVDFLFPVDNVVYITDWKTGKRDAEKHRKQLLGYVSWASYHFGKNPEEVIPVIAYLQPSYDEKIMKFNEYDIEKFIILVREETEEMYSFCSDVGENIPEDKKKFSKTSNNKICNYCNYRELCKD